MVSVKVLHPISQLERNSHSSASLFIKKIILLSNCIPYIYIAQLVQLMLKYSVISVCFRVTWVNQDQVYSKTLVSVLNLSIGNLRNQNVDVDMNP